MINNHLKKQNISGHGISMLLILCLFGLCVSSAFGARKKRKIVGDNRIYLIHADNLRFDQYSVNPDAQILTGHVSFRHQNSHLTCDSAYFYQATNSVKAFGHVHFRQGDTLSLKCDYADYDGQVQFMRARHNVVLHHRKQVLNTDSLDYDRLYNYVNFSEGGTLSDGKNKLVADWGRYYVDTREAEFYYNVHLKNGRDYITTDTMFYDTRNSVAHVVGPSKITSKGSVVNTSNGYYNTKTDRTRLYGRSTMVDKDKSITGDSLFYVKDKDSEGFGNVIYVDKRNKNSLHCGYLRYNEKTGYGFATRRPVAIDYSQKDTLWMHSDTMKIYTFNINTDSVYRKVHCFPKVRAFRQDVQAVCDSMVFNSQDSCMTMYKDPIVWNAGRQLLGEKIQLFMNDSTLRYAHVIGQALSVESLGDSIHYNQVASREMEAFFVNGKAQKGVSFGNVQIVYYPINDKDSSMIGLNYTETDTAKMFMDEHQQLVRIWMPKATGTLYPMSQIPPVKYKLPSFAWFDNIRPKDKNDIFEWRGKREDQKLKNVSRHTAPLQRIGKKDEKKGEEVKI